MVFLKAEISKGATKTIMEKIWISGANGHVGSALVKMLDFEKYKDKSSIFERKIKSERVFGSLL